MKKIIYIASGEAVASYLKQNGYKNVFAFNEAMCEGDTVYNILSPEFCTFRALAYDIDKNKYTHFAKKLEPVLQNTDLIELFFDYDMFCAVNTITLLAYLEETKYKGNINFNLVEQNGTANIIKSFSIKLGNFNRIYKKVLVERKFQKAGIEHIDNGITLYLNYKKPNNEIIKFIKANTDLTENELCKQILHRFSEYGIGDKSVFKLIKKYKKKTYNNMELWDLYTENRKLTNENHIRGNEIPNGRYHLVVQIWIKNRDGKYLICQRSVNRPNLPLMWECVGGSVLKGETSIDGAIREVKEEVGIDLAQDKGQLIFSKVRKSIKMNGVECKFNDILDVWLFEYSGEVNLKYATTDEVAQTKWLDKGEIQELYDNKKLVETLSYFFERDEF